MALFYWLALFFFYCNNPSDFFANICMYEIEKLTLLAELF